MIIQGHSRSEYYKFKLSDPHRDHSPAWAISYPDRVGVRYHENLGQVHEQNYSNSTKSSNCGFIVLNGWVVLCSKNRF